LKNRESQRLRRSRIKAKQDGFAALLTMILTVADLDNARTAKLDIL
jgi:hypothetical protein